MDTINTIELSNPDVYPNDNILKTILGNTFDYYSKLIELYNNSGMNYEWRYYKDGKAWLCKVQKKKKTIVWMSAWRGYMQASIFIPLKCIDELLSIGINENTKRTIQNTKNVGKSRPCIFNITNDDVLEQITLVMKYKESI